MVKVTEIDQKVYLIRSGQNIMKKSLGRRRKRNDSYFTGGIKCMVDSSYCRLNCGVVFC
mgnify:CR=1 FL=1